MKLSEMKGNDGLRIAGKLLVPIGRICADKRNRKYLGKNLLEFFGAAAQNTPEEVKEIMAIYEGVKPEELELDAASSLRKIAELVTDEDFTRLFG